MSRRAYFCRPTFRRFTCATAAEIFRNSRVPPQFIILNFQCRVKHRRRLLEITVWSTSLSLPSPSLPFLPSLSYPSHPSLPVLRLFFSLFPSLSSPSYLSLPFLSLYPFFFIPFFSPPKCSYGDLRDRCKLPQRVRAEPSRQTIFGAF